MASALTRGMFQVTEERGFLPISDPPDHLPDEFKFLEEILADMPITKRDGQKGLLALGNLGKHVENLPLMDVSKITDNSTLLALFRDYTFLASAYLLENCHINFVETTNYGLGRDRLPANISIPLCQIAYKLHIFPFMEYAQSYALYNWKRIDKSRGISLDNLELIRSFEGSESEKGFILVHVCMVSHSGKLVKAVNENLRAAEGHQVPEINDITMAMQDINQEMAKMWKVSLPNEYQSFRTFIMGIKNQPMFPNGVVYEGVSDEPQFFRGESGANDSIIPTLDNLLQIKMPENPLTAILQDFRKYRPAAHRAWLEEVSKRSQNTNFFNYCLGVGLRDKITALLKQIQDFRQRHWNFVKEYILKYSNHPRATGGSPIATWLSNQLLTVLNLLLELDPSDNETIEQIHCLNQEVDYYREVFNQ
jgi:indoleamine 2,3-dioxygenase